MNLLEFAEVIVGFRPESFLPAEIVTAARPIAFRFVVKYIEYLGAERLIYGSIEGFESKEIVSRLSRTMPTGYEEGSVHTFAVAEGDLRFAAADQDEVSLLVQRLFSTQWFRVYTNSDVIGVELAGAMKNVIALAAGGA